MDEPMKKRTAPQIKIYHAAVKKLVEAHKEEFDGYILAEKNKPVEVKP